MIRPEAFFDAAELRAVRRLLPTELLDGGAHARVVGVESEGVDAASASVAASGTGGGAVPVPDVLIDAAARCAWSSLTEPGDSAAALLIERVGAAEAFAHVVSASSAADILAASPIGSSAQGTDQVAPLDSEVAALHSGLARWRPRLDRRLLFRRVEIAGRLGARLLLPDTPGWPGSLDDLGPHAPLLLWLRGDPAAFDPPIPSRSRRRPRRDRLRRAHRRRARRRRRDPRRLRRLGWCLRDRRRRAPRRPRLRRAYRRLPRRRSGPPLPDGPRGPPPAHHRDPRVRRRDRGPSRHHPHPLAFPAAQPPHRRLNRRHRRRRGGRALRLAEHRRPRGRPGAPARRGAGPGHQRLLHGLPPPPARVRGDLRHLAGGCPRTARVRRGGEPDAGRNGL